MRSWLDLKERPGPEPAGFSRAEWGVLFARGARTLADAQRLLEPGVGVRHDPLGLTDLPAARDRVVQAVAAGERIVVYGDYDADGLTATALLSTALERLGAEVTAFIPSRFEEGYGLQAEALERLANDGARLVIAVDCGVRALEEAQRARQAGLDLVITDHHEPGDRLPEALAVVNPKRADDSYPFKELSGAGLAFKLAEAVGGEPLQDWLEGDGLAYLAVGTVADLAPLVDENRTLVGRGLTALRRSPPVGLATLMEVGGVRAAATSGRDIGFSIGPRLNAAGRLGSADVALRLLRARTRGEALPLAEALDRNNRERQDRTKDLLAQVRSRLETRPAVPALIFDADPEYGEGLLGPAASKLVEEWSRPAVLVSLRDGVGRGSARSVPGFHITHALEACAGLLDRYGGHAAAAGFSLPAARIGELQARLEGLAAEKVPSPGTPPPVQPDVIVRPDEVTWHLLGFLDRLEPMGQGFPPPLFVCPQMTVVGTRPVGRDRAHLKLTLRQAGRTVDAIAFRHGAQAPARGEVVDVAFYAERESYQGLESVRWNVQAIRPAARLDPPSP